MKRKIILVLCIILLVGCEKKSESPEFVVKCSNKLGEDGWIKAFCISAHKKNSNTDRVKDNYVLNNETSYYYDGYNLKHRRLENYYIPEYDKYGNEVGKFESEPTLSRSVFHRKDVKNITAFFEEKKFKSEITIDDLNDLKLERIDKKEIVEMFNEAIKSEPRELGKYLNIVFLDYLQTESNANYKFQVGYYLEYGNIIDVDLEIIFNDGNYLSDLVKKGKTTKEYKEMQNDLENFEKYILEEQNFEISEASNYNEKYKKLNEILITINQKNSSSK